MTSSYIIIQVSFAGLTLISYSLLLRQLHKSLHLTSLPGKRKKKIFITTLVSLSGWALVTGVLASSGFFSDFDTLPPKIGIAIIVPLIVIVWMVRTKTIGEILQHTPAENLILLQSFRIVVEVLLWMLFVNDLAPVQMTFEGSNFDILSGITAPVVAFLVARKSISIPLVVGWHLICLALLVNIVATAILSAPTPFRVFMNEPSNTIVAQFPIVWLPALLVPLAYGLHFLSLRQAFMKRAPA